MTKIIRSIWIDERIPDSWRHAIIIPLHKELSVTDPRNYRGISLLRVMCKNIASEKVFGKFKKLQFGSGDALNGEQFDALRRRDVFECGIRAPLNITAQFYADDVKIYCVYSSENRYAMCSQLQSTVDSVVLWACKWGLAINPSKCCVLHLGNGDSANYIINGILLKKVRYH
ncbi:hypothetical protein RB195_006431 [Necator americanus]|uniref:Reverse transcriptase domain-containing protein n=1 Tax=Necator americanus TaxID=51031 RepID=A0ABR1BWC7_NECAM